MSLSEETSRLVAFIHVWWFMECGMSVYWSDAFKFLPSGGESCLSC